VDSAAIHGNKSQAQREKALATFKAGTTKVLVATDIAARGIDVTGVSHVINYDLPNIPESYVHRIGRTARAGASGIAISFCGEDERDYLKDIEKTTRQKIPAEDRRGTLPLAKKGEGEEREERGERGDRRNARGPQRHHRAERRPGAPAAAAAHHGAAPRSEGRPVASTKPVHRDTGAQEESLGRVGFLAGGRDKPARPQGARPQGDSRRPQRNGGQRQHRADV
jgi:ATP-dependent RNA helicase RhlE